MTQLSRREKSMRETLESRGFHFIPPTFELPLDIPAHDILYISGEVVKGKYDDNTIVVYLQNGKLYVPDVNAMDEKALNSLLHL